MYLMIRDIPRVAFVSVINVNIAEDIAFTYQLKCIITCLHRLVDYLMQSPR